MDRTQDSDSWGVGSIPAGCIRFVFMEEYMKDILDKIKPIVEKLGEKVKELGKKIKSLLAKMKPFLEKAWEFVKVQKRYFGVAGLFVVFVCVLFFFTGEDFNAKRIAKQNSIEVSGEDYVPDAEFEIDAYPEVNDLIETYFDAYVNADVELIEELVTPLSDMEKSYITAMSQFYEEYQNVTCYTKHGLSRDSYIVSACFEIKFAEQETTAPSMVLFYLQTNEEGDLYINNLYSDFNMKYAELAINKDVYTALKKYTVQEDYLELFNLVESEFNQLIRENNEIYQLTKRTIPATRQEWEDTVYYAQSTEDEEETQDTESTQQTESTVPSESTPPSESTTPAPSETPQPQPQPSETPQPSESTTPEPEPEPVVKKVKVDTNSSVNVRKGAGKSYDSIGKAYDGDVFVKLGEKTGDDGKKWIKIQYTSSKVGYIRADYLDDVTE